MTADTQPFDGGGVLHDRLTVECDDGSLPVTLRRPSDGPARGAVVIVHGQGATRTAWLGRVGPLLRAGLAVASFDARLHGEPSSTGTDPAGSVPVLDFLAMVDGTASDLSRIVARLSTLNWMDGPVGVFGFSFGAQVALVAGSRDPSIGPIAALAPSITQTPLDPWDYPASRPDPAELARRAAAVSLGRDTPQRLRTLAARPLWLAHGRADEAVPFDDTSALADRLAEHGTRVSFLAHGGSHHPDNTVLNLTFEWLSATIAQGAAAQRE